MVSRNTPGSAFNILIYVGKSVKTKSTTSIRMSMGAYARSTSVRMVSVQPILRAIVNASSNLGTRSGNYLGIPDGCSATTSAAVFSMTSHGH